MTTRLWADFEAGLAASRRADARHVEALILGMKTLTLASMGRMEEAATVAERSLVLSEELGDEDTLVMNLNNLAYFNMLHVGDHGRAADFLTRQIDISRRQGNRVGEAHGLTNLAYNQLALGLYEEAQAAIVGALQLSTAMARRV